MSEPTLQAQIDAANAYEHLFVPALFQQWAPRVVHAAQIHSGQRVLDVACGTGVLAREAASCVGPTGFVAGVDPNPGMLAVASRLAPGIEWHQGAAESLPYADQSFNVVVSQFGLMFFTDQHLSIREMLRVMVPKGHLSVAVWDSLENTPAYAAEVALKAPTALRAAGLLGFLTARDILVHDHGDVSGFRWRADKVNPDHGEIDGSTLRTTTIHLMETPS